MQTFIYMAHTYTCIYACVCVYLGVYVFVHICRGCAADAIAMPLTQPLGSAHCLVVSSRGVVSENINGCSCVADAVVRSESCTTTST